MANSKKSGTFAAAAAASAVHDPSHWRLPTYSVGLALSNSDHKDCSGSFKRCRNPKPNLPCHDCILANRAFLEDHPNPHV